MISASKHGGQHPDRLSSRREEDPFIVLVAIVLVGFTVSFRHLRMENVNVRPERRVRL